MKKSKMLSLGGLNGFMYGMNAVYYAFIPLYLGGIFDSVRKGQLLSIGPIVTCFALIFWGRVADISKTKNRVLAGIVGGAAVCFAVLTVQSTFLYTAIMLALLLFFMAPYSSLTDTVTLEALREGNAPYGPFRLMGTIGYGAIAIVTGFAAGMDTRRLVWVYIAVAVAAVICIVTSPLVYGGSHRSRREAGPTETEKLTGRRPSLRPILLNPDFVLIMLIDIVVVFSWYFTQNFLPTHLSDNYGMTSGFWGISICLTLVIEFPFFGFFDRIFSKISLRTLLIVSVIFSVARYAVLAFTHGGTMLLVVSVLTGGWVTVVMYCAVYYIHLVAPPELHATGMSVNLAIGSALPQVMAGQIGGLLVRSFGFQASELFCAVACALCLLPAFFLPKGVYLIYGKK